MTGNLDAVSLGYIGQRRSTLTGTYLLGNGYRSFNPIIRRFSAWDSLSPFGEGGAHGYAYCAGDPTNSTDRSGHIFGLKIIFGEIVADLTATEEAAATGTVAEVATEAGEVVAITGRTVGRAVAATATPALGLAGSAAESAIALGVEEGGPVLARKVKQMLGHAGEGRITKVERRSRVRQVAHNAKEAVINTATDYVNRAAEDLAATRGLSPMGQQQFLDSRLDSVGHTLGDARPEHRPFISRKPREVDSSRILFDAPHSSNSSRIPEFDSNGVELLNRKVRRLTLEL